MWRSMFLGTITLLALLVHGYHLGIEDQAIYLPAIEKVLHPGLFPHDSDFFLGQTQYTLFPNIVAFSIRFTHLPLEVALFVWQIASMFLLLLGCWRLASRCFATLEARWAGTAMVAALLTLPIAGTSLYIADQYLHPRALATGFLLFAVVEVLDRKFLKMTIWLVPAALVHIQMAFFGALLCLFVGWSSGWEQPGVAALPLPLKLLFQKGSDTWRRAARTRTQHYLLRWEWYEWLGALAPLALLWWFAKLGEQKRQPVMAHLCRRLIAFGTLGIVAGLVVSIPERLETLAPYQPMRVYHLLYIVFVLVAGGLLGDSFLRRSIRRWLLVFVPLCAVMFVSQRQLFPGSPHIEFPGRPPSNQWVQAFLWIRDNTPENAYFALNPRHMDLAGEDEHGFRAFSQRSMLADEGKDPGVVLFVPELAPRWWAQVLAEEGWEHFGKPDFERLRARFGVTWVVIEHPVAGLPCPYRNSAVLVCRIE